MLSTLFAKTNQARQRLTRLDGQPLGRAALVVVIFLDLFILSSLFSGLDAHTRQLATPDETVPPLCRAIVIDQDWNAVNRLDRLAQLVTDHAVRRFEFDAGRPDPGRLHPMCRPVIEGFEAIRDDAGLADNLGELVRLGREADDRRARLEAMRGAYDTRLLEKIAGEPPAGATAAAMRQEMAEQTAGLEAIAARRATLRQALGEDTKVRRLFEHLAGIDASERQALAGELRRLNFWFPAKRLGMEMLFLLPLLAVFYLWNSRSLARDRPYQTLVSAHLLVVTMIPVLAEILRLVYDILPRKLIRHVIELLEALNLVAIWHYLVIATGIAVAMAMIYLFQKKLFSPARLMQRRLARGECHACGLRLPAGSRHCPACGADQYRVCVHCNQSTLVHGRHCTACGREAA